MSYRPICDTWILARPKVKYYGAFPSGFLHRARALLGVGLEDLVLHVCGGKVRDYPFKGFGKFDRTLDLDPALHPDYLRDARKPFPYLLNCGHTKDRQQYGDGTERDIYSNNLWDAVLIDRPYTQEDAQKYVPGPDVLPSANQLVKNAVAVLPVGGRVGILDYVWPQPPKNATEVAIITVVCGRNNRARLYSVFERTA